MNTRAPDTEAEQSVTQPSATTTDLSAQIANTVERLASDRVRVMRLWGDYYRCNWIAPRNRIDPLEDLFVRQSRFLHVTKRPDGTLSIRNAGGNN
ncbi:MAG: hypothetical protein JO353_05955 [Phycisphaerae bacterium]|nr:hypothetical protein [Phycisphaerae bacterium]